jgi:hypothetical protein
MMKLPVTWNRALPAMLTVLLLLLIAETAVNLVHAIHQAPYRPSCTYVVLGTDPHPVVKACP